MATTSSLKKPFSILLEGNIGSGKSSLLKLLSEIPGVIVFTEPVSDWINVAGFNLLEKFYSNPELYSFTFQIHVFNTLLKRELNDNLHSPPKCRILDRSILSSFNCFSKLSHKNGYLTNLEFKILEDYYNLTRVMTDFKYETIIYLKTDPETSFQRLKVRSRKEEGTVPLIYLQELHTIHEEWINSDQLKLFNIITVDGNLDLERLKGEVLPELKSRISALIENKSKDDI